MVYQIDGSDIVQLSGKATDQLGVETITARGLPPLPVTNLERSLIDAVVRPVYAGGPKTLLQAFRAASGKLSSQNSRKYSPSSTTPTHIIKPLAFCWREAARARNIRAISK